jgi:hypothetical protein
MDSLKVVLPEVASLPPVPGHLEVAEVGLLPAILDPLLAASASGGQILFLHGGEQSQGVVPQGLGESFGDPVASGCTVFDALQGEGSVPEVGLALVTDRVELRTSLVPAPALQGDGIGGLQEEF